MNALIRHARFTEGTDMQKAARAGALCMVVRSSDWLPQDGDIIRDVSLAYPEKVWEQLLGSAKEEQIISNDEASFPHSPDNDVIELQETTPGTK
jgi:hypothetical protein